MLIGLGAFIVLIAIVLVIYKNYKPQAQPAPVAETETTEDETITSDEQSEEEAVTDEQTSEDQNADETADDSAADDAAGTKNIVIEVKDSEGNVTSYEVTTNAEFLRQAMDEAEGLTYEGTDSEYGMMVEVVNGEQAIYAEDNAYWAFYVNGEYGNYGIDSQPVTDGDTYSIVYEAAN